MTMPINAVRGEKRTTNEKSYVIGAKEFNRIVAGISGNLPISTTFREIRNNFPFKVSTQFKAYPKEHPDYESLPFTSPKDWVAEGAPRLDGTIENGVQCAVIEAGACFCQDTANIGPTFTTEAWLLGDMAKSRIESEVEDKDYSSCVGNSKDPPSKCEGKLMVTKFRTYTWENSLLPLRLEKYEDTLSYTSSGVKSKTTPIPHPFSDLGCRSAPKAEERTLYHSDLILQISRPKMKTAFDFMPSAELAGMSTMSISSIPDVSPTCGESTIISLPSYIVRPPVGGLGILGFLVEAEMDLGIDQFVMARVYLVSPPEEYGLPTNKKGAVIPIYFADFVKQYIFGNVCYGWTNMPAPALSLAEPPAQVLGILGVLAGGVGYAVAAAILSFTNTIHDLVMAVLRQKKIEGSLWYV